MEAPKIKLPKIFSFVCTAVSLFTLWKGFRFLFFSEVDFPYYLVHFEGPLGRTERYRKDGVLLEDSVCHETYPLLSWWGICLLGLSIIAFNLLFLDPRSVTKGYRSMIVLCAPTLIALLQALANQYLAGEAATRVIIPFGVFTFISCVGLMQQGKTKPSAKKEELKKEQQEALLTSNVMSFVDLIINGSLGIMLYACPSFLLPFMFHMYPCLHMHVVSKFVGSFFLSIALIQTITIGSGNRAWRVTVSRSLMIVYIILCLFYLSISLSRSFTLRSISSVSLGIVAFVYIILVVVHLYLLFWVLPELQKSEEESKSKEAKQETKKTQ